ncbi:hypothetical protein FACS1894116_07760 [Betaproteobacteria bacterium]|nr:hypothetical protein FACS1894116_07760 [Betaproteobacteria bacterium]GHT97813.1 hypothetical protein FACS1894154_02020 [Betaproteobacteria bacterium]GHU30141.1 hypothetical protein FACS189497_09420 [Betaproteobacteria bacterium]
MSTKPVAHEVKLKFYSLSCVADTLSSMLLAADVMAFHHPMEEKRKSENTAAWLLNAAMPLADYICVYAETHDL